MAENRKLGCGCAVFCFVILLMLGAYLVIGRPAALVRGEIARIVREGAPVTLKDLDGPKIADSQNGAVVYQKAFALVSGKAAEKDMLYISRAVSTNEPLKTPAQWNRLKKILAKYGEVIPIVEAAQARPECRFPIEWEKNGSFNAVFYHLAPCRDLNRLLCARAIVSARDGDSNDAVRCLDLSFRLGSSLDYNPPIIAFLTRLATINQSYYAFRKVIETSAITDDQAQRLSATLASIDFTGKLNKAYKVERAAGIWEFNKVREPYQSLGSAIGKTLGFIEIRRYNQDELFYLKQMRNNIETSQMSYREAVANHKLNDLSGFPSYALYSALLLPTPVIGYAMQYNDRAQVIISGCRIALALAVYKNDNKTYPAKLSDISKFFGGKIPIDLFSGKDFIYRQQGNGYLLYSIGANLKDDGGKEPAPRKSNQEFGDIVWKVD